MELPEPSGIVDGLRDEPWSSKPTSWGHFPELPSLCYLLGSLALPFSLAARKPGLYLSCSSGHFPSGPDLAVGEQRKRNWNLPHVLSHTPD